MNNFMIKLLAKIYALWVHRLERRIGYRLEFSHIPDTWVDGQMIFDMSPVWAKHQIKAVGINYFTVGKLVNGISSRFLRHEKQYQSWFGAYLVKFDNAKKFTLQDHFDLAIADQKNWLGIFGDLNPFIEMPETQAVNATTIKLGDLESTLYEFLGGPSHSDVGAKSNNLNAKFNMRMMAEVMNLSNPKLKLTGQNFLPHDKSVNYETVTLKGYVAIIELEENTKVVLYGNASALLNNQGVETVDYFPELKEDILKAFESVKIKKL